MMKNSTFLLIASLLCSSSAFSLAPDNNGIYRISTGSELEEFAAIVNNGQTDADAVLVSDIDMTGITHTAIGTTQNPYRGKWDGRFHTIDNLEMDNADGVNLALFGVAAVGAKFSNTILGSGCYFSGKDKVAGFVSQCRDAVEGTIEFSCLGNEGAIHAYQKDGSEARAAAIAGPSNGNVAYKFANCYNTGEVRGLAVGALSCYAPSAQVIGCFSVTDVKKQANPDAKASNPSPVSQVLIKGVEQPLSPWTFCCFFGGAEGKGTYAENGYDKAVTWKPPYDLRDNSWTIYKVFEEEWAPTGMMCWYLNNQSSDNPVWGQNLDEGDQYPSFMPGKLIVFNENGSYVNKTSSIPAPEDLPEISAVEDIKESAKTTKTIYTLKGIKIEQISTPGLYIIDGKKVIIR